MCREALANPLPFRFLENYGTPTPDTAYSKQDITFEGPGAPYTSYEWQIANDTRRFTQQKFSLYFYENNVGNFPVLLIARRPPNTRCFPKDDGVDTLTRVLTLLPRSYRKGPIYGKFQGSNLDAPKDTFTIRVFQGLDPYNYGSPIPYDFLRNLGRGCQSPYFTIGLTWRGINFNYGGDDFGCRTESGTGYLTTRDSIRIDYSRFASLTGVVRTNHVFLGRRIR
ncbi:hypothetical protein [Hymenobacter pini]|uniref:hypothetical protein n=1 Tax=Hymenobacter pini TaxID=2880879 RepID=UPI001CF261AD|nr:hypothetical protein [Hymenobacter pini]MCA8831186.1 hypothetical protein [Hymenobacter pini]